MAARSRCRATQKAPARRHPAHDAACPRRHGHSGHERPGSPAGVFGLVTGGSVLLVTGAITLGAGVGLLSNNDSGVGIGGATMLGFGIKRNLRWRADERRMLLQPSVSSSPIGGSVGLRGRF